MLHVHFAILIVWNLTMTNILYFSRDNSATREREEVPGTVMEQLVDMQPSKRMESE